MSLIVQKFGGTSVATPDRIKKVALRVKAEVDAGHQVIVVVSAMAGMTNSLIGHVREISAAYDRSEYDAVVSAGEQISAGLLALALKNLSIPARSWMGWQVPLITSSHHAQAKIEDIPTDNITQSLQGGLVAVVAGFQGISSEGRITTIGRGGSDTTAVALAAFFKAERCDIYTDVDGVYTADPRYVSKAGKLDRIAYSEMLELSSQGAKVLQRDSVELAMNYGVKLRVLSSLSNLPGTLITHDHGEGEATTISGLVHSLTESKITLTQTPESVTDQIRDLLLKGGITIDMVHETLLDGEGSDVSFTLQTAEQDHASQLLKSSQPHLGFKDIVIDEDVVKLSVVGPALNQSPDLTQKMFQTLALKGIQVQSVSSSDIKSSVVIKTSEMELALSALHTVYCLDKKDVK